MSTKQDKKVGRFVKVEKELRIYSKMFDIRIPVGTELEMKLTSKDSHVALYYNGIRFKVPTWLAKKHCSPSYLPQAEQVAEDGDDDELEGITVPEPRGVEDPNWTPFFKQWTAAMKKKYPDMDEYELAEIGCEYAQTLM